MLALFLASCNDKDDFSIKQNPGVNPWNNLKFNNNPDNFQFAIVTDLTGRLRPNVFPDAVRKLNLLQPEFIVTIGDLIEGHTNDVAQLNREWDAFFKAVEPLEMPIFYIPGNHDYWYETTQGAGGKHEIYDMADVYKKRVGAPFYHFIYKNVLFLILNNNYPDGSDEAKEQERYIKKTLEENSGVRWTFTFLHWSRGFQGRHEQVWQYLAPLVKDRKFTAFAGNSHQYVKYDFHGKDLINLGTVGGMSGMRGPSYGEYDHLVWITMTDSGPNIVNLELNGIYDKNVRTVKSKAIMSELLASSPISSDVIMAAEEKFTSTKTRLRLTNTADIPLVITARFDPHKSIIPYPAVFTEEVPANSGKNIDIELNVENPPSVKDTSPIVLNWTGSYTLPGEDPDVEVNGKHRVVIDTAGEVPANDWPVVTERFSGRLDPAWVPLGPGGGFDETGEFILTDNPPPLPGERKDNEGRYTDGPLFETAVQRPVDGSNRVYRYIDGRGIFMMTPLFQLPVNGIYRDIPPDSFEARLKVSDIVWRGANPRLNWEFWDRPDRIYNYGPSYLSGVNLKVHREGDKYLIELYTLKRLNLAELRAKSIRDQAEYRYTDSEINVLGRVELDLPPSSLAFRVQWRESTRDWRFYYGLNGAAAETLLPGGEFNEVITPSSEGKRNMIYVHQAKVNGSVDDPEGGFSVKLDEYMLLH